LTKLTEPEVEEEPTQGLAGAGEAEVEPDPEPSPRSRAGLYGLVWRTGLLNVLTIARRELGSYFVSAMAWVVGALVILPVTVFGYLLPVIVGQQATLDNAFNLIAFLYLFLMPLYTMRLLAEERRQGTLEMLLTSPVRDWELVVGKWLAGFVFFCATIAFTLVYLVLLLIFVPTKVHPFGLTWLSVGNLDPGLILSGYLGILIVGATFAAVGVLASSVTQNQIIAAVLGVVGLILLWYLGVFSQFIGPPYDQFFDYVGGSNRNAAFARGQVQLKDAVYFASIIFGCLFLATRVLESRKWR
jgi:ABC-2 type transport system permease protein